MTRSTYKFVALYILYALCIQTSATIFVIRKGSVQMKLVKCEVYRAVWCIPLIWKSPWIWHSGAETCRRLIPVINCNLLSAFVIWCDNYENMHIKLARRMYSKFADRIPFLGRNNPGPYAVVADDTFSYREALWSPLLKFMRSAQEKEFLIFDETRFKGS